jgi:AraC-like DNA-binding protein
LTWTTDTSIDALSDALRAIRVSGSLFFRVELRAPFAVFAAENQDLILNFGRGADYVLPFHLVTEGSLWFEVPGEEPVQLGAQDLLFLPRGTTHALMDRPGRQAVPVATLEHKVVGRTMKHGGDGPVAGVLCGFFRCTRKLFNPLLDALPTVMVIRHDAERTEWLGTTLERAFREDLSGRPGKAALVERLTEMLFVEVVQSWLAEHGGDGWLAGLSDPVVGPALALLHADPAHPWMVESLAQRVGVSRTVLAERFRAVTGDSIIRYLTRWRMELAADLLLTTDRSVAAIAAEVGYQSEAALNRAFKVHLGEPPASWRRARR